MSFGFSIGDILTASTLCIQIYERCKASRGEFREISAKVHGLRGVLSIIGNNVWRGQNFTDQERTMLESVSVPLLGSLRDSDKRLRKYSSLGTKAPRICDQVGWACEGGVGLRQKLDSQINSLNIFNTSVLLARQVRGATIELQPSHPFNKTDSTAVHTLEQTLVHPVGSDTIQNFSEIPSQSEASAIGWHSLWDGIRFLVFLVLTLLAIAFILVAGGFVVVGFVLFPFVEIPTGLARCESHWKRFTGFFGRLFNNAFKFVDGL